ESLDHFLFQCPKKLHVWCEVWQSYFVSVIFSEDAIRTALYRLSFPHTTSFVSLTDSHATIASALLGIWCSHWLLVFQITPFVPSEVVRGVDRLIALSTQENCLRQGLMHRAFLFN
ncbi:hypothetical protein BCV72DRAFT_218417, partial [Rhizopus microsporus var. microsporus]